MAVIGCGGIGLSAIQGGRIAGANKVIAVDMNASKLELAQALGATHVVNPADGDAVEVIPLPPDDEFPQVFAGACRRQLTRRDRETVERYGVNVCLAGPGGSLRAAIRMLRAGAAVVRAGGAGVFVDNSGRAHPSRDWLEFAEVSDDGSAYQAL